ncbi:MAG: DUF445 domain-containing protein [Aphanocapsa lilacina HA4352-LM1]|nr:DUF445 domain-containing protein [Aphanocapsa lilacina HA4352-LM1]
MALTIVHYVLPPIVGALIGFTSDTLAIKMLFRPYKPKYILGRQVPLTPGLFPKGQERFARKVAQMLTDKLLTPDEVHRIAQRLLTPERLEEGLRFALLYALGEYSDGRKRARLAVALGDILQAVFSESLPKWIDALSRSSASNKIFEQIFDQVAGSLRIEEAQAVRLAEWIEKNVFTPDRLRLALINLLTNQTIDTLDKEARERAQGGLWLVANVVGIKGPLSRFKSFCVEQPAAANELFTRFLAEAEVRERLTGALNGLSVQTLSMATVQDLKRQFVTSLTAALSAQGPGLSQRLGESIDWSRWAAEVLDRVVTSEKTLGWIDRIAEGSSRLLDRYLTRELEPLVMKFLPALGLEQMVITKICNTSPQELEAAIEQVARNELRAIPYVGMVLGFCVGLFEVFLITVVIPVG